MTEKNSSSTDLEKKFQKWFENPVSPDLLAPAEPDRSIGEHVPLDMPVPSEVDKLDKAPVSTDLPYPAEAGYSYHIPQTSRYELLKLSELIIYGFIGAISLGTGVGFIISMLNSYFLNWFGISWPDQYIFIFWAVLLGFIGGLFKGSIDGLNKYKS